MDFLIAAVGFVLSFPLFVFLTILLFISNKGNPFFIQRRPGKNEEIFKLIKFRTMNNKRGVDGNLLPDSDRLTGVGRFVRSTSLDEIPQLINVILGDMSLIGPRPLLIKYLDRYSVSQRGRHIIKPGITGWAQVNGRNALSWNQKFELDLFYVKNVSFLLDFKILVLTLQKVLLRQGVSARGQATTVEFKGSE